jgi:hypothetical protein
MVSCMDNLIMKKKENKLPDFRKMTLEEEANFWDTHSVADYWDELGPVGVHVGRKKPKRATNEEK